MPLEIDRLQRWCANDAHVLGLAGGLPALALFPARALARAFADLAERGAGRALQYGWPEGDEGLRGWIASRLRARGADVAAEDVIVTCGAQQAIGLATEAIVRSHDLRSVEVGDVTYPAALDLFRTKGVEAATRGRGFAYVMPGVANPRGDRMSEGERARLLAARAPIIADEAYAELRFDGTTDRPLLADARDRVFHVGSFSKTLCPGLRIGFLVPPRARRDLVMTLKHSADLQAASLTQALLAVHLGEGGFDEHLARARAFYARRAEILYEEARRRFPSFHVKEPEGGFSIFVETDAAGDDALFLKVAAVHGTSFDPGRMFRPSGASSPIAFRLCYSALEREEDLVVAMTRLERAWTAFARSTSKRAA